MEFATWLAQSSLLPKAVNKVHDIFFIICAGMELGLPPMAALRGLYTVHGRTALESKTKAALCIQKGAALYFKRIEFTPEATTWETQRRGKEPERMRYTRQEAIDAFLAPGKPTGGGPPVAGKEGPWRQFTQRMISHRALGWLCDDVYPDVVMGVATAEDFDGAETNYQPISTAAKAGAIDVPQTAQVSVPASLTEEQPTAKSGPNPTDPPAKPKGNGKPPIFEIEVDDLIEKMGKFTNAKELRAWATDNIQGRECVEAIRKKLSDHYEGQLKQIADAAEAEKKMAAPTPKGDA